LIHVYAPCKEKELILLEGGFIIYSMLIKNSTRLASYRN
jgi:hypothetical protein